MDDKEKIRSIVWNKLQEIAQPDSRFHWDFNAFIPDYAGSEQATNQIYSSQAYLKAKWLFITPDNNLTLLRKRCIQDNKPLIIPTYAIKRGFWFVERGGVPEGQESFAASLDGMEHFGKEIDLCTLPSDQQITLLVTGASVINFQGIRLSHGPSYFDLEWLILRFFDLITPETEVIVSVHDCQLVDYPYQPMPYQVVPDKIITPTRTISIDARGKRPDKGALSKLPANIINEVQVLKKLII